MEPPKECYAACCPDSLPLFPGDRQDRKSRQRDLLPAGKALPADEPAQQQVLFENIARAMGTGPQGNRTPELGQSFQELDDAVLANENIVGYVEALVDCKLTESGRKIPDKASVVS